MKPKALLTAALLVLSGCRESADPPSPSLENVEPQVASAIDDSRAAVMRAPRSAEAWGGLGLVYHAHGLYEAGAVCYDKAIELDPDEFRWWYYRAVLEQRSAPAAALELVKRAEALSPRSAPVLVLEATLYEQLGDVDEARAVYESLLQMAPDSSVAAFHLGRLAVSAGQLDEGRRLLEKAGELQPTAGAIQAFLARVYRQQGDLEGARAASERARELAPDVSFDDPLLEAIQARAVSTRALQRRARYEEAAGRASAADSLHRRLVELHPDDAEMRYNFANFLGRTGRSEEAELNYRKALELDEGYVSAYVNLGNLLASRGELQQAEPLLRKAVALQPEHPAALVGLSNALAQQGQLQPAAELLDRALSLEPENLAALQGLSQIRASEGSMDAAARLLDRALSLRPDDGRTHFLMAVTRARQGDFALAWRHAHDAERLGFVLPVAFRSALETAMPEPLVPSARR